MLYLGIVQVCGSLVNLQAPVIKGIFNDTGEVQFADGTDDQDADFRLGKLNCYNILFYPIVCIHFVKYSDVYIDNYP